MPKIYLSPSTQDWNMYVTGSGSEEYNMNLLADALVTYLLSNGIQYRRNRPEMTAGSSVREANQGEYDLYLALHSNAAPEGRYGEERGIIAFYYPGSVNGQRAAELIAEELRKIYPLPGKVTTRPTTFHNSGTTAITAARNTTITARKHGVNHTPSPDQSNRSITERLCDRRSPPPPAIACN